MTATTKAYELRSLIQSLEGGWALDDSERYLAARALREYHTVLAAQEAVEAVELERRRTSAWG